MAECPRCGGGAYLAEEEFVRVLENTEPMRVIAKAVYQCRACSEKFSRLVCELLEAKKKMEDVPASAIANNTANSATSTPTTQKDTPLDGIKFF